VVEEEMRTQLVTVTILIGLFSARAEAETTEPTDDDKTAMAVKKALDEDRKVRREQEDADRKAKQEREGAEVSYKKEAVVFRDFMIANVTNGGVTSVGSATVAYRNGRKLSTGEFYEAVERPDLAATYHHRMKIGRTLVWTGLGVALAASAYGLYAVAKPNRCEVGAADFSACLDRDSANQKRAFIQSSVVGGGGLLALVVGFYVVAKSAPATMNEAHDMADTHNAKLRRKYGLPTARVAPYATPDGGGVAMVGRF
jgi:hypothetical protein